MEFMALLKSAFSPLQKQETFIYHLKVFFFSPSGSDFENTLVLISTSGLQHLPEEEPGQDVSEQTRVRGGSRA